MPTLKELIKLNPSAATDIGAMGTDILSNIASDGGRNPSTLSGALGGLGKGASLGMSVGGPVGAAIGGGLGALLGGISGHGEKRAMDQAEHLRRYAEQRALVHNQASLSEIEGQGEGYYRNGGQLSLRQMLVKGGKLQPIGTRAMEAIGKSHEQGGIQVEGGEIEGGEIISADNYVFSKVLGFADAHKRLMKPAAIIEQKAPTKERVNSLKDIMRQERELMHKQELLKSVLDA